MIHLASQPLDYDQLSKLTVDNEAIKEKKVVIDSNYFTLTDKRTVTSDEDQGNTYLFPGTYVLKETQAPKDTLLHMILNLKFLLIRIKVMMLL